MEEDRSNNKLFIIGNEKKYRDKVLKDLENKMNKEFENIIIEELIYKYYRSEKKDINYDDIMKSCEKMRCNDFLPKYVNNALNKIEDYYDKLDKLRDENIRLYQVKKNKFYNEYQKGTLRDLEKDIYIHLINERKLTNTQTIKYIDYLIGKTKDIFSPQLSIVFKNIKNRFKNLKA